MSGERQLVPVFSSRRDGKLVATVWDDERFHEMLDACELLGRKFRQISVEPNSPQKKVELVFMIGIDEDEARRMIGQVKYIV